MVYCHLQGSALFSSLKSIFTQSSKTNSKVVAEKSKAVVTTEYLILFDFDSTAVRLQFERAIRPFDVAACTSA